VGLWAKELAGEMAFRSGQGRASSLGGRLGRRWERGLAEGMEGKWDERLVPTLASMLENRSERCSGKWLVRSSDSGLGEQSILVSGREMGLEKEYETATSLAVAMAKASVEV
jgi:hypothetical protein